MNVAGNPALRDALRQQITRSLPIVVAFFICPREQAERCRPAPRHLSIGSFSKRKWSSALRF